MKLNERKRIKAIRAGKRTVHYAFDHKYLIRYMFIIDRIGGVYFNSAITRITM